MSGIKSISENVSCSTGFSCGGNYTCQNHRIVEELKADRDEAWDLCCQLLEIASAFECLRPPDPHSDTEDCSDCAAFRKLDRIRERIAKEKE